MKMTSMLASLLGTLFLISCNPFRSHDVVREFVPGTYITEWRNEFTQSKDTIIILAPTTRGSDGYRITKRSYYQQTIDGKDLKPQFKIQNWIGSYNPEVKTLVIGKSGRVLLFNPDRNELVEGSTTYNKIK
ncbi:MAG: hypothetical protein INR73_28225 [Williamsia sp.]|nr:hypothetical protein [Williamsia sp.]